MPRVLRQGLALAMLWNMGVVVQASEWTVLGPQTWDEFVPQGKEVDAIYGDFVLRNDHVVAVIAQAVTGRKANMTVQDVGACVIDLTERDHQSDQLSAYYPGARRFLYRLHRIVAQGKVLVRSGDRSVEAERIELLAENGRLPADHAAALVRADSIMIEFRAAGTSDDPEVDLQYLIQEDQPAIQIVTVFRNQTAEAMTVPTVDDFRADRTFVSRKPGDTPLAWVYDKWWGQAYGVVAPEHPMRLVGDSTNPRRIEFLKADQPAARIEPGEEVTLKRYLFPARHLVACKAIAHRLSVPEVALGRCELHVVDQGGKPVPDADIVIGRATNAFANARSDAQGDATLDLPAGSYNVQVSALARGSRELELDLAAGQTSEKAVELAIAPRVLAHITGETGGPIPCKVQFAGVAGTEDPFFFPDTGEHAVHNLYYSHNGKFAQEIPPGTYDVLISYGPEYDVARTRIQLEPGKDTTLEATLHRAVQSPGWVSTEFHSHSSPSGDNVTSQLGRVLNLLCDNLEFCPCTEHNRLDTYSPHLRALGVEHLMGTCTGMELTGRNGSLNHQNAFPLTLEPHTQDGGAPGTSEDPELQISRLAFWENRSEKLVQTNHPDMGWMFFDRDGDGEIDRGFDGMFPFQDVIEVHPHWDILKMEPYRRRGGATPGNNSIFNWLQLINQGHRLPGVVNTDAHYNFHGSGWLRNYVKCQTDDPAQIQVADIVQACEHGHIILSNGPYLEVSLSERNASGKPATAIAGDDLVLTNGQANLAIRVQCANWLDVDRVQVLFNGRPLEEYNWTRESHSEMFSGSTVKFDHQTRIDFGSDTHIIVVATGEHSTLGNVYGPSHANENPTAISNPIFVDVDGNGFQANGDTLGHPLPAKAGAR